MQSRPPSKLIRIKITTCIPSPYQVELFDALAAREDVRVKVLYWRTTTKHVFDLTSSTRHASRVLKGFRVPLPFVGSEKLCLGIIREILAQDYDVFVVSGLGPTSLLAMFLLTLFRRPWLFWGERPHPCEPRTLRAKLRKCFWGFVGRASWGILGMGKVAVQEYHRLGVPKNRLANVPYSPDGSQLLEPSQEYAKGAADVRKSLGAGNSIVFLFCGQVVRRKGVDVLLRAFEACHRDMPDCLLVVLGDGPQRGALEAMVSEDARPKVIFTGVVQRPELFHYYLAADVFVFPSRYDGWGVVVNEAMASGLPVITTDRVGAAADMVVDGHNGYVVPVDDVGQFAKRMSNLVESPEMLQRMKHAARETAVHYTATAGAEKMVRALRMLTGQSDAVLVSTCDGAGS